MRSPRRRRARRARIRSPALDVSLLFDSDLNLACGKALVGIPALLKTLVWEPWAGVDDVFFRFDGRAV